MFVSDQAAWWYGQGDHILELVHDRYTDPRLLEVQGRLGGVELVEDFVGHQMGADMGTCGSRKLPSSRGRSSRWRSNDGLASNGWIDGNQAMAAINGGTAEALIDDYELDVQRQSARSARSRSWRWRPDGGDPRAGVLGRLGPGPEHDADGAATRRRRFRYAEDYDDHQVHIHVLQSWMKTREFELQGELCKQAARNHLEQHKALQMQTAMAQMGEMQASLSSEGRMPHSGRRASPAPATRTRSRG